MCISNPSKIFLVSSCKLFRDITFSSLEERSFCCGEPRAKIDAVETIQKTCQNPTRKKTQWKQKLVRKSDILFSLLMLARSLNISSQNVFTVES